MRRSTSSSYVMPKSPRSLFSWMAVALMATTTSTLSRSSISILILLSGAKPGSTRAAWLSSNSLPPNSRYSLPPNWAMRSRILADCVSRYR